MNFYNQNISIEEINNEINNIYNQMDDLKNNKNIGFSDGMWLLEEYNLKIKELVDLK